MDRPALPDIPHTADERTTLEAFLDFYRAALIDRAHGLDQAQLQIALPPSTLTLSRLIGHSARVEQLWFAAVFDGESFIEPWCDLVWDEPDPDMTLAQTWTPEELLHHFDAAITDSKRRLAKVESLDALSTLTDKDTGEHWSMRWILVHLIEEYARHCGHADFIRESIDGDTASRG